MLLKFKCFALLRRFVQSPLKPGDTKHAVIALRAGDSVRLCEHVQRSFAKTLPFDRLGTDGRAKGKIGERGREGGRGAMGGRIILGHRGEASVAVDLAIL